MPPIPVTAMIFTLNEELHLPSCLDALANFGEVVVVDSFSIDRTEAICRERGVAFHQNRFEGFGSQRNWAFDHCPTRYPWILVLDADERVTPELEDEIGRVLADCPESIAAFRVKRRFYMWGRWLRYSNLYPSWVVRLVHKERVRYVNRGHAETQEITGEQRALEYDLIDENLKGIDEWFERQGRYARKEAEFELAEETRPLALGDLGSKDPLVRRAALKRLALRMPGRPLIYFLYAFLWRGGFLEGRDGLVFCLMKAVYQQMVQIKKYDAKRRRSPPLR